MMRASGYWRTHFTSPGDQYTHESTAPVIYEDLEDVVAFLWVIYNPCVSYLQQISLVEMESRRYNIFHAPLHRWIRILRMASHWEGPEIGEFAVSKINGINMDVLERIQLYQNHRVERRLILPFYLELARREEMLGPAEVHVLNADALVSIIRAREMLRAPYAAGADINLLSSPLQEHEEEEQLDILATAFQLPVASIQGPSTIGRRNLCSSLKFPI